MASRLLGGDFVCGEMTVNPRILFLLDIVYLTSPTFKRLVQARFKFIPEFILLQCCKQSLIKMCNYIFIFIAKWTMFSNKPKIFGLVISVIVCAQTVFFFPGIWRAPERRVNKSPSCYILLGWSKEKRQTGWVLQRFLGGVCHSVLQILTLFQTKKCHFPHPLSDLASKIHTHSQTWPLRNYVIIT